MKRILLIAILSFSFSACCTTTTRYGQVPPGTQTYREAWIDGCNSGHVAVGRLCYTSDKDVELYKSNAEYHQGWDDGFKECKARYEPAHAKPYR